MTVLFRRMRNVTDKICNENQHTHYMSSDFPSPPPPENLAVYEIISKNVVKSEGQQAIWRMRVACWIRKATRAKEQSRACSPTPTHASTEIRIVFRRCSLVSRDTHFACLACKPVSWLGFLGLRKIILGLPVWKRGSETQP
jgi:hypothetical protein